MINLADEPVGNRKSSSTSSKCSNEIIYQALGPTFQI